MFTPSPTPEEKSEDRSRRSDAREPGVSHRQRVITD